MAIEQDIHLAVASISGDTRAAIERMGFMEDIFSDCRNCSPTQYHATFRGDTKELTDSWWRKACDILRDDPNFDGLLEQEALVKEFHSNGTPHGAFHFEGPLRIQQCPPEIHKACDVHIGIRADEHGHDTLAWLDRLGIASFGKTRSDGLWRIHTATFDKLVAGRKFYEIMLRSVPRSKGAAFKIKLERIERAFRFPSSATTLPITYSEQLFEWLASANSNAPA